MYDAARYLILKAMHAIKGFAEVKECFPQNAFY